MKMMKKFCNMHDPKNDAKNDKKVVEWCSKQCDKCGLCEGVLKITHEYEIK